MNWLNDFTECRNIDDPIVFLQTFDYRDAMSRMIQVRYIGQETDSPAVMWDIVRGHTALNEGGSTVQFADTEMAPATFIAQAIENAPEETMLFLVIPDTDTLDRPDVIQAIANVRSEFEGTKRCLIVLGPDIKMPSLLKDCTLLRDSLPSHDDFVTEASKLREATFPNAKGKGNVQEAAYACRGLTIYAARQNLARKLTAGGKYDVLGLYGLQRSAIETMSEGGLTFREPNVSFKDVVGLTALKKFYTNYFNGPNPPRVIVWLDEMDKVVTSAATGSVADNTGVSQDMLGCILAALEENGWQAALNFGTPGSGKSFVAQALGTEFQVPIVKLDMGALKDSLVGASERKVRLAMSILLNLGGSNVFFFATANRLDTLPPELRRRFTKGIWFFNKPTPDQVSAMWKLYTAKYAVSGKVPPCDDWVGSDVRNVCCTARDCGIPIQEAVQYTTLAVKASASEIRDWQTMAEEKGYLDVEKGGPFRIPRTSTVRKISK